jgi:hypothetical protein
MEEIMNNIVDSINHAVSQSLLTRFLANIFLFVLLIAAVTVVGYEILIGQQVNQLAYNLVFVGIGYAIHLLGINQGVTLTPTNGQPKTTEQTSNVEDLPTITMPAIPSTPPIDSNATPKKLPAVKV